MATQAKADTRSYRVLTGLNYPPDNQRAEPGDVVDNLPASSVPWLLATGAIEAVVSE